MRPRMTAWIALAAIGLAAGCTTEEPTEAAPTASEGALTENDYAMSTEGESVSSAPGEEAVIETEIIHAEVEPDADKEMAEPVSIHGEPGHAAAEAEGSEAVSVHAEPGAVDGGGTESAGDESAEEAEVTPEPAPAGDAAEPESPERRSGECR